MVIASIAESSSHSITVAVSEKEELEFDHFIPIASNGAHQPYNWVAACVTCNTEKADMLPWEFNPDRFRQGDRDPSHYI